MADFPPRPSPDDDTRPMPPDVMRRVLSMMPRDGIDSPYEFLRKLGFNLPKIGVDSGAAVRMGAEMLPGAGVKEGVEAGRRFDRDLGAGDYLKAAASGVESGAQYMTEAMPYIGLGAMAKPTRALIKAGGRGVRSALEKSAAPRPSQIDMRIRQMAFENDIRSGIITEKTPGVDVDEVRAILADQKRGSASMIGHNRGPKMGPDYDAPAGSDPRYLGAAEDRSEFTYVRHKPARGVSARTTDALEAMRTNRNGVKDQLIKDIRRGEELGGSSWYNTEELRDWFIEELGEKRGHREWREFMDLMGAASPGSKVDANIANAAYIRHRMAKDHRYLKRLREVQTNKQGRVLAHERLEGYGHKTAGSQEQAAARQARGEWEALPQGKVVLDQNTSAINPKPKGFTHSLIGGQRNIAADLHFTRYMAMASGRTDWLANSREISDVFRAELKAKYGRRINKYFKKDKQGKYRFNAKDAVEKGPVDMADYAKEPGMYADMPNKNEYAAFEEYINEVGRELGMTAPQVQANLWMGAADKTGVDVSSQGTFMELLRARMDKRAKATGKTRRQVGRAFIRHKGLLVLPPVAAIGAQGYTRDDRE